MNKWEEIAITGIDLTASFTDDLYEYRIRKVEVTTATWDHEQVGEVTVTPGEKIILSVTLGGRMGQQVVDVRMTAPKKRGEGSILVTGGGNVARAKSHDFDALLAALASKPRDDDVVVRLFYGAKGRAKSTRTVRAAGTVLGERTLFLSVI